MNIALKVGITCCLLAAPTASFAEGSRNLAETILTIDTSIPFAPGAEEHLINVRGLFGQPSYQQGFIEGMHFRIDPDGGALFSRDPRLRNNVFEVVCENGIASCIAIRGAVRIFLDTDGLLTFALDADAAFDAIYVGYGLFDDDQPDDNWKKLNTSLDTVSVDVLAGYDQMVMVKDGKLVQQILLEGILVVGAYLKWVSDGQPVKVLPASWEDSHEKASTPAQKFEAIALIGDGINFQSEFKNDWAIYSPLLQFDDVSFENSYAEFSRYGDPELGLGVIARKLKNDVVQVGLNNEKQNIQFAVDIKQYALETAIDLAKLSSDELANLQLQFDVSLRPAAKVIETNKISNDPIADLNSYVSKLDVASGEKNPELVQEIISILMASVSLPTTDSQPMNIIAEPVNSTRKEKPLASIINSQKVDFSKSENKENKPDIGGNICKPAILATIEENVIITKPMQSVKPHAGHNHSVKFSDPSEALKGLPGIYVFTDYLAEPAHLKGKFNGAIHYEIEARLKAGGIRVITKEELPNIPGQPRMEVYFSKANVETGCSFAVWISVRQSMLLGRDQKTLLLSGTWGSGGAHLREYSDAPEFNTIMNHVDRFIADYQKANSKSGLNLTQ